MRRINKQKQRIKALRTIYEGIIDDDLDVRINIDDFSDHYQLYDHDNQQLGII